MPAVTAKRVLKDETSNHNNSVPTSAKKRKLGTESLAERNKKLSQAAPKSSFEDDLGKLTQDLDDLKNG